MNRPKCTICGREAANTDTQAGHRLFRCVNSKCPEYLRKIIHPERSTA